MKKTDKILIWVACLCLFIGGLLLHVGARAQGHMPTILNPNPEYWYQMAMYQQARADTLAKEGHIAIVGLTNNLKAANDTIQRKEGRIGQLTEDRKQEKIRADNAETTAQACAKEIAAIKPQTWIGRTWKTTKDIAAVVGGIVIVSTVTKLIP